MLESSLVAWCYYLVGALGLFAFWWRLTRAISLSKLQRSLRAVMAVMLICPFSIADGYSDMAPAFLMMAMETVFEGPEAFLRVGPTLLSVMLFAGLAALAWDIYLARRANQKDEEAKLNHDRDELLAESSADQSSSETIDESHSSTESHA